MSKIRVFIVDDHAMFREGVRSLLSVYEDIEVTGEAANGKEALGQINELAPDVVLMDIAMPVMSGLEAARRMQKEQPNTRILILTQYEDREYLISMLRVGVKGYIPKIASASELVNAIRTVHHGESYLYPSATTALIEQYLLRANQDKDEYEGLTNRQREILQLVSEGRTNREIAEMVFISVKTVIRHRSDIMDKLGLHNRTELIKYAISKGLIETPLRISTTDK